MYNFPLSWEYNMDLPRPASKKYTWKKFFIFKKTELSELKK